MYMTYVSGNSKEIRGPAALQAMDAAEVKAGTPEGTIISAIGISISILISLTVMTIVAIVGNFMLQILPTPVITSLRYLLPSLFGSFSNAKSCIKSKSSIYWYSISIYNIFLKKNGNV